MVRCNTLLQLVILCVNVHMHSSALTAENYYTMGVLVSSIMLHCKGSPASPYRPCIKPRQVILIQQVKQIPTACAALQQVIILLSCTKFCDHNTCMHNKL